MLRIIDVMYEIVIERDTEPQDLRKQIDCLKMEKEASKK
jgi:hypothetical protein